MSYCHCPAKGCSGCSQCEGCECTADSYIEHLKAELAKRDAEIVGLSSGPGYTMEDVDLIERTRGKPYERLRATVAKIDDLKSGFKNHGPWCIMPGSVVPCNACEFCIDGMPCRNPRLGG